MAAEAKRLQYIDALKGVAIIFIVFYHLVAPSAGKFVLDHLGEMMLAMFFVLSGFFFRRGRKTLRENIADRARSTLTPFFRCSLFFWLTGSVYLVTAKDVPFTETLLCLRNFLGGCIWNRKI